MNIEQRNYFDDVIAKAMVDLAGTQRLEGVELRRRLYQVSSAIDALDKFVGETERLHNDR